ncbi:hypothetical protein BLA29_001745 [Euroglyphus maynei]|uniref:Uncharacterized protein n=1 Tax=Euroglyphus maynei TaxID=6958 RepID=A0A1Y3BSC2_EURMA|nr:hypothetical protein BLA29_001745 [Euroglyphus maynei]
MAEAVPPTLPYVSLIRLFLGGGVGASPLVRAINGVLGSDLPTELCAVAKNSYDRPHSRPVTV